MYDAKWGTKKIPSNYKSNPITKSWEDCKSKCLASLFIYFRLLPYEAVGGLGIYKKKKK